MQSDIYLLAVAISVLAAFFSVFLFRKKTDDRPQYKLILKSICVILFIVQLLFQIKYEIRKKELDKVKYSLKISIPSENYQIEPDYSSLSEFYKHEYIEALKDPVKFNCDDYKGFIEFWISYEHISPEEEMGKVGHVALKPTDGFYVECFDANNNLVETHQSGDDSWYFIIPDSTVTIYVKRE